MQRVASFLKYTVQENLIIECSKKQKEEIKIFFEDLKKEVGKYNGEVIILNKKINKNRENLLKQKDKKIILVLDEEFFPSKPKEVDNLFYYLSRLPLEIKETNIILVENKRDFYLKLSHATMSSLLPYILKFEMEKIPMAKPSITEKEINYLNDAIRNGWGEKCYDYIKKFEDKFKKYIGSKFSLATSSCTGAINLALATIGLKRGDEVIVSEMSWITAVSPITYFGAKPVFVDITDSWCIDPKKIEEAITHKTKAILVTHLYGNLVEMDEIMKIAKRHELCVIEDAAEALGSSYREKKAGSIGNIGVFSFHGAKTCTTGEGGMFVTNDEELFRKAQTLNNGGRKVDGKMFYAELLGYKYKMSNFQAALGLAQLERIEELVERKRQIFYKYKEHLSDLPISMNLEPSHTKNSFWLPTIVFNQLIDREKLIDYFKQKKVDIRPFFYPISSLPMFKTNVNNVEAYTIYKRGINLPSYHDITNEEIKYVCDGLREFIK